MWVPSHIGIAGNEKADNYSNQSKKPIKNENYSKSNNKQCTHQRHKIFYQSKNPFTFAKSLKFNTIIQQTKKY